jgi:transposase
MMLSAPSSEQTVVSPNFQGSEERSRAAIIGCDFHTRYQTIATLDEATGELIERRFDHQDGEADAFYQNLRGPVRVGIEATGPICWFELLLAELGHELWIGDAAKIRASEVRKQKTDERDARLILDLLLTKRFPKIWVPTSAERDLWARGTPFHRTQMNAFELSRPTLLPQARARV